ncbi:MAG: 50S ribosomal protein L22 [Ureaplasma sp.]|nr:50S ribosomal protein L22 [Ureaplasma sp.]MDE6289182.1 50S ribosomal protein L22 [Ureaplasma sp.]
MKAIAKQENVHVSPRKAKLVVDLVRGKKVTEAVRILQNTNKKSAPIVLKLLSSAISNAINNHAMNGSNLYVYEIFANEGPTWKRQITRAKGSADRLFKRTTHFKIVLSDDLNERAKDLAKIKELVKRRAQNNSKSVKEGE